MSAGLPLHQWSPPHKVDFVDEVCDQASRFRFRGRRMVMDDAQRAILADITAHEAPGRPTCFEVAAIAPRQNVKSAVLQVAAIADVTQFDVELHVWTAHLAKTSTRAFQAMRAMIASDPDTKARFKWPPNEGKGQEVLETIDGRRIEFYSRSTGAGRGDTSDKLTVDEALFASERDIGAILPSLAAIDHAQVRYASSGGLATSDFLRDLRDRGRAGGDPRLAYHEFGAPRKACAERGCDHRDRHDPGCALNDRDLWFAANIAYHSGRITEERLLDFRKSMSPDEFMREFLTWWEEPLVERRLLDRARWLQASVPHDAPASRLSGRVALAIEVAPDETSAAVGLVGRREDSRLQGELIGYGAGTGWVPEFVRGVVERRKPLAVMLDEQGPAAVLLTPLRNAGVTTTAVPFPMFRRASSELRADLQEIPDGETPESWPPRFTHTGSKPLDDAARSVRKRQIKDVWVLDRDSEGADPIPVVALAIARLGFLEHENDTSGVWVL